MCRKRSLRRRICIKNKYSGYDSRTASEGVKKMAACKTSDKKAGAKPADKKDGAKPDAKKPKK
jgi:hypothetical protein